MGTRRLKGAASAELPSKEDMAGIPDSGDSTGCGVEGTVGMCVPQRKLRGKSVLSKGRSQTQKVLVGHDKELELCLREPRVQVDVKSNWDFKDRTLRWRVC